MENEDEDDGSPTKTWPPMMSIVLIAASLGSSVYAFRKFKQLKLTENEKLILIGLAAFVAAFAALHH
jgi:hypothetical protein